MIAGDFNCALDCKLDRDPGHNSNDQGCVELLDLMQKCNVNDIFRRRYPMKRSFTFKRGSSKSRIDYFLIETTCDSYINNTNIDHFPFSDHDIIYIATDFSKTDKGPGVWKMNVATINSAQFRESIEYLWATWKSKGSNPQFLEHFSVNLARSAKIDNSSVQSGEQFDFSHKIIKSNV